MGRRGAGISRARRALARRAGEPLSVRPEPRLVRPNPAGNTRAGGSTARVHAPRGRRPARDGRQRYVLLSPQRGPRQHLDDRRAESAQRSLRRRQRGQVRRAWLRVFQPRHLRRLLSRIRGLMADGPRGDRCHLRAGVGEGSRLSAYRRRLPHLQRRRVAPFHRRDPDRCYGRHPPGPNRPHVPGVPSRRRGPGALRFERVRAHLRTRSRDGATARRDARAVRHRGEQGARARRGGRPNAPRRRHLHRADGSAHAPTHPQPARPPHPDGRGFRGPADRAPCESPAGSDLRRHRLEHAFTVGRRADHGGPPDRRGHRFDERGERDGGSGFTSQRRRRLFDAVGHERGRRRGRSAARRNSGAQRGW